jgi:hypothetical protein
MHPSQLPIHATSVVPKCLPAHMMTNMCAPYLQHVSLAEVPEIVFPQQGLSRRAHGLYVQGALLHYEVLVLPAGTAEPARRGCKGAHA